MTPDKHNKALEIFLAASDKSEAELSAFIQQQAAGDKEIIHEVKSLLLEHRREDQLIPSDPASRISTCLFHFNNDPDYLRDSSILESRTLSEKTPDTPDVGRFSVGTIIADRYRIIQLLGRGGMGEVYRADDITLNQSVALKFLPRLFSSNEKWLDRFRNEVRLARLITHPNVCRVFDIGEFEGDHFISMEYIDGENLASLLHRIGRLPHDKALQIARQLCAGLAAAHDRGVLHQDLKPANVMIDGQGHARITDFGLAVPMDQLRKEAAVGGKNGKGGKAPLRIGTPAYMAPEQFGGNPTTVSSDIYALGLILYEMFTGQRAFKAENIRDYRRLHASETPMPPSDFVKDLDPIVERVIFKCIEKYPTARPTSAMAVFAALPGGDPLRAILAAGETPSPSVVAAAGESLGNIKPRVATAYLLTALVALICFVCIAPSAFIIQKAITPQQSNMPASAETAIKMLHRLGYTAPPRDRTSGFAIKNAYYNYVDKSIRTPDRWKALLPLPNPGVNTKPDPQPRLVYFWYRQSPEFLVPLNPEIGAQENDPPQLLPGMVRIHLDPQGTLIGFRAQPQEDESPDIQSLPTSSAWAEQLLAEAHLTTADLKPTSPKGPLPVCATSRIAYEGTLNNEPIHVEAAEYNGRPVFFSISGPAGEERFRPVKTQRQISIGTNIYVWTIINIVLIVVGGLLAWRNYHSGKADRVGALRLAFTFAILGSIAWFLRAHHVPDIFQEYPQFQRGIGINLYRVCIIWIFYLALEPYVRRVWPEIVISWNRAIAGKFFDPLVGRDILIGTAAGTITMLLCALDMLIPRWLGFPAPLPDLAHASHMITSLSNFSDLFSGTLNAIFTALGLLLLIVVLRMILPNVTILRNKIAASLIFILVVVACTVRIENITPHDPPLPFFSALLDYARHVDNTSLAIQSLIAVIFLFILVRHGLVALFFCLLIRSLLLDFPITYDLSAWYAKSALIPLTCILLILTFGFHTARGGRSSITLHSP